MAGVHWNEKNLPNPETTTGAQAKADQALAAAKAYTDQNKVTSLPWGSITGKPETATRWPTWNEVTGKPSTFPPSGHNHDDRYYTKSEVDSKLQSAGNVWMVPGDTILVTSAGEWSRKSPQSDGYHLAKRFSVGEAGRYRITFELRTTSTSAGYPTYVQVTSGGVGISDVLRASHGDSWVGFTIDCHSPVPRGGILDLRVNPGGAADGHTARIRNVRVRGVPGAESGFKDLTS